MKQIFLLFVMCIIGLFIRITALDKPEGLWNDEYMGWLISTEDLWIPFFNKMINNCHMPLYYLYLKCWSFVFGDSDIALRLSSVFTGIICIISVYFLGKEYKHQNTGLLCALFATLSGFLIYFSQEVRLYSLIFIISCWLTFFFIKAIRNLSKTNFTLYILFNFLLLITHTISFVYVFFNLVIFSILILRKKPELKTKIFVTYGILFLAFSPLIPFLVKVLTRETLSQNWGIFNFSKIIFTFIDYFSPIQTNITNSALNMVKFINSTNLVENIFFILIPALISIFFLFRALKQKEEIINSLALNALLYFSALIIAAAMGKLVLSTKYSTEIYPTLILLFCTGICSTNRVITKVLASAYFILISAFIFFNPNAPQNLLRPEGHKTPAILLQKANISKNDHIISLYHQLFRYEKYLNFIPTNKTEISKNEIAEYLLGDGNTTYDLKYKGKEKLQHAFLFQNETDIEKNFDEIFSKFPSGKKIAIIIPNQVTFFSVNNLIKIASDKQLYDKTEIMFMAFSYAKIKLLNSALKYCNHLSTLNQDEWYVIIFEKK